MSLPKPMLYAESLAADPRIKQAKELMLNAVQDHQKNLTGVKPPHPELKQGYLELLQSFAGMRGNKLWFPFLGSGIGNGALVELLDGSVKYDFISGIGVHVFGHSHPQLIQSSIDAALADTTMQGHLQQNADSIELSKMLIQESGLDHCLLTTSGAMANENALKMIFQKKFPAHRILAFSHCFAGRTLSLAQITDKPSFREGLPDTLSVDYIPFFDPENPVESQSNALRELRQHLKQHPREYAAFIFELVLGENGFYPGNTEFFKAIMQVCKENQVSVFIDEVQTFGRTSRLFAFQHFGLDQLVDVVTIGKLSQVCATLFKADHNPKPGLISQTFTGSTSAIKASKVILNELLKNNYFGKEGKNAQLFNQFSYHLGEMAKNYPQLIQGPFGIGGMVAFTPFNGEQQKVTKFVHRLFEEGVISFIAGSNPTRARFLLPLCAITSKDIDAAAKIIEKTLLLEAEQ